MATLVLSVICFFLAIAVLVVGVTLRRRPQLAPHAVNARNHAYKLSGVLFLASALFFVSNSIVIIDPGQRGIVTTFGYIDHTELTEGAHFVMPWSIVHYYNVRLRKTSINKLTCETSDTQSVDLTVVLNWSIAPEGCSEAFQKVGEDAPGNIEEKAILPALQETIPAEVSRHKITELVTVRHELKAAVQEHLTAWLSVYQVTVEEVAISEIDFSEEYDQAIETKQIEEQKAMQKEYELKQREIDAQMVTVAAQAEADALLLKAKAQEQSNRMIAQSLTPTLLQQTWMNRWDGRMPQFIAGDASSPIMMMLTAPPLDSTPVETEASTTESSAESDDE